MRRSNEPLFWSLFSAGGVISAVVVPALIVVTFLLFTGDMIRFSRLEDVLTHPIGRLTLFGVAALTFAHAAHRFRHTLVDLGLKPVAMLVTVVCYGAGVAGMKSCARLR